MSLKSDNEDQKSTEEISFMSEIDFLKDLINRVGFILSFYLISFFDYNLTLFRIFTCFIINSSLILYFSQFLILGNSDDCIDNS